MKTKHILRMPLILAAFAAFPVAAPAQDAPAALEPNSEQKALADSCSAHKFQTLVKTESGKASKVRVCGEPGQSEADWINTLKSSVTKAEADASLSPMVKEQIVTDLKKEIARLEGVASITVPATNLPAEALAQSPPSIAPSEPTPQYSSLPPLPDPKRTVAPAKPAPILVASDASEPKVAAPPPPVPAEKPRLTIRCALPRETFGSCASLQRESQLLVRADEDLAAGTSLRFLRGGDNRAEVDLGPLKKGETLREKLPGKVCSGVLRGKVEVQVVAGNQVAGTLGPYGLYCGS
jgi:hypothetical protein